MATHVMPHVRTKRPLRGRVRAERVSYERRNLARLRHATSHGVRALGARLVRRGPMTGDRALPTDFTFRVAAGGVILAAAVLGIAMGLAQPTWMLAAALIGAGALLTTVVALRPAPSAATPTF